MLKEYEILKAHCHPNFGDGTDEYKIELLEKEFNIKLPEQLRDYLKEVGYAEIFGDEIYSIYNVPDEIACCGLDWMNKRNELLSEGYLRFFSNDIDGVFYIHLNSGKVYLNSKDYKFANSFLEFITKMLAFQ